MHKPPVNPLDQGGFIIFSSKVLELISSKYMKNHLIFQIKFCLQNYWICTCKNL
jgi:hypothetical protein